MRFRVQGLRRFLALVLMLITAAGCATAPDSQDHEQYAEYEAINDPLEPLNRQIFQFNLAMDAMFLRPFAEFYRLLLPPPVQEGVHNVLANARSPIIFANDLFQAEFHRAAVTLTRFLINSTLGVGGLADPASDFDLPAHNEDFGQTLAVWGVPEGPFLMLPLIGPSNPRDATGLAVDSFLLDPMGLMILLDYGPESLTYVSYGRAGMTAIDARAQTLDELDDLKKSSLDFYAALRSLYRQYRISEIYQGSPPAAAGPTLEDYPEIPD